MKKVIMTRERIYSAKEFEVDPNEPDIVLSSIPRFENSDDEGVWNEYYRVGVIDTDDNTTDQNDMFARTAVDFYNRGDAQQCYAEMVKEVEGQNAPPTHQPTQC